MADNAPTEDNKDPKQAMADAVAAAENFKGEKTEVTYDGYTFEVDTAMLDDVEIVDLIERIEAGKSLKATVEFLHYLIGVDGYEKMKAFYIKRDGRFKLTVLTRIYYAIFEKFDPKG